MKKRFLGIFVLMSAVLLVIAACFGGEKKEVAPAPPTPSPTVTSQIQEELLCPPQKMESIDFSVLNTEVIRALEKGSVAWKMLELENKLDHAQVARRVSTAFLSALNVPLGNKPQWFIDLREQAIQNAGGDVVDYSFLNTAFERFTQDARFSHFRQPEQKFKLFSAVNDGFIKALGDPFAVYKPPRAVEFGDRDLSGTYYGIGTGIGRNDKNEWEFPSITEGGPADKAGLQPNDVLLKVNGKSVKGCLVTEIIRAIRGKEGTPVDLTIRRDEQEFQATLKRAEIKQHFVYSWPAYDLPNGRGNTGKLVPYIFPLQMPSGDIVDDIAYIKVTSFTEQMVKDLYYVLGNINWDDYQGLVVDLRNNGGGRLDVVIAATGYFLPPNATVMYERDADGKRSVSRSPDQEIQSRNTGVYFSPNLVPADVPVVILVNENSASASEVLAAALQDHQRALLIGERTAGKGTVNRDFTLRNGEYGAMYLAIRLWESPEGRFIEPLYKTEQGGLAPDIKVRQAPPQQFDPKTDPTIYETIRVLGGDK